MNIFDNPVLVTLSDSEPFVTLQTNDTKHGQSQRFYLHKQTLLRQLGDDAEGNDTEADLLNFCTVARAKDSIRFQLVWLHGNCNDDVHGYRQTFFLPIDKVEKALAGERVKHLSHYPIRQEKAEIWFTEPAQKAIIAMDKLKRHAIRRFIRDNFCYGREEKLVVQTDSWVGGFYFFSTVSKFEGGIVPHETEVIGKDGKPHRKVYFGLHT